ncbi:MAG TPA: tetratricopeptide repeat protein [Candidatus Polarisedimenticolaceae bacterium]|nr:tetratricopeptide repeat protein [Candidatus Polarisedimenticolaceae bacterium]
MPLTAGIGVVTAAVFARSLTCGFVGYDDPGYVLENPRVLAGLSWDGLRWAFTTTRQANWHPLTWLSLMADASVGGTDATLYHATNVLLHVIAAVLLFQVLRLATEDTWKPALVAALCALHPLRVESVTWVAERKDVLAAVFWMATLLAWVRFRLEGRRGWLAASVTLFAVGLLAKPMLVTLPGVLALLEIWPLARVHRTWRPVLLWLSPFVLLSMASSAVTLWAQRAGGALGTLEGFPPGARLANAVVSAAVYLGQGLWPAGLATPYPYRWETIAPARVALSALVLLALTALALHAWHRRPWALVGWLWYLGTLLPVAGLIQVGEQAHADRYTYLPMIGVTLWLVWDAAALASHRVPARALAVACALWLVALASLTWRQQGHWKNGSTLMLRALAVTEDNAVAHDGYGLELYRAGREAEALPHFREAVRLSPASVGARVNLAAALSRTGDFEAAVEQLREVVHLRPQDAAAQANLASMLLRAGRTEEAHNLAIAALQSSPGEPRAHEVLGVVQALRGDPGAEEQLQLAGDARPRGQLWVAVALSLMREGRQDEAERALRKAVEIEPTLASAHTNLGVLLAKTGRLDEALTHFEEAVRLGPEDEGARRNLEKVQARLAASPGP